jgi:FkbM family methyltransferase
MLITDLSKYLHHVKGAIHVGAHDGEERYWYKDNKFTHVLWFEPNSELFWRLYKNLENFPNHVAYNFGIHDELTFADLHISSNDGQSSSILELGTHKINHPTVYYVKDKRVRLMRLDGFFTKFYCDPNDYNFLNVDVQGVELNVIKSLGNLLHNFEYVYVEVNLEHVYKNCALLQDIDYYLSLYNFTRVEIKMKKANWGDAFYIKRKLL